MYAAKIVTLEDPVDIVVEDRTEIAKWVMLGDQASLENSNTKFIRDLRIWCFTNRYKTQSR
jgi:hypothetical protein